MKKLATNLLEFIGTSLWGFRPNLMKDIVGIHGWRKSLFWFMKNMPKYEKTLKKWGPERTHLLVVAISGINGCPYCTYGHGLAFQLHYFKNKKRLFPIDEVEMMNFNTKEATAVLETLKKAIAQSSLFHPKKDLARFIELKQDPTLATSEDDQKILHLIKMFAFLNVCGIEKQTPKDAAHDPINKDLVLLEAYRKERAAASKKQTKNRKVKTNG